MNNLPYTVRRSIELVGLFVLGTLIVVGNDVLSPLLMAFFISIMLLPVLRFLRRTKVPEGLAIFLCILFMMIVVGLLVWFFSSQIGILVADFPQIKQNVGKHLNALSEWIGSKWGFSTQQQVQLIKQQNDKLLNYASTFLSGAAGSVTGVLIFIGLLPIYIYLMLFYKNLLLRFIFLWFPAKTQDKVREVIHESESIIKSYLIGLLIQISYITFLLGGVLLLFGIKHAILIGAIFAILNLIPYVGALIGNLIGILLTLSSSPDLWPVVIVLASIAGVQFLDNNILMPRIVGSKVKINALATIVGVIIAGSLAGISGMFLSLPVIAVLKIIFDRTDNLKQWGVLLGDERPDKSPMNFPMFRRKDEKVQKELEEENNMGSTEN